jgi:hypothetical protein
MTIWRKRYGKILCPGAGFVVLGFGPSAAMPISRINRCTRLRLMRRPSPLSIAIIRREPRNGQAVKLVDPPHQLNVVVIGPRRDR